MISYFFSRSPSVPPEVHPSPTPSAPLVKDEEAPQLPRPIAIEGATNPSEDLSIRTSWGFTGSISSMTSAIFGSRIQKNESKEDSEVLDNQAPLNDDFNVMNEMNEFFALGSEIEIKQEEEDSEFEKEVADFVLVSPCRPSQSELLQQQIAIFQNKYSDDSIDGECVLSSLELIETLCQAAPSNQPVEYDNRVDQLLEDTKAIDKLIPPHINSRVGKALAALTAYHKFLFAKNQIDSLAAAPTINFETLLCAIKFLIGPQANLDDQVEEDNQAPSIESFEKKLCLFENWLNQKKGEMDTELKRQQAVKDIENRAKAQFESKRVDSPIPAKDPSVGQAQSPRNPTPVKLTPVSPKKSAAAAKPSPSRKKTKAYKSKTRRLGVNISDRM